MMKILSCGNWPANALADINFAKDQLHKEGYINNEFTLEVPPEIERKLGDYRSFFLESKVVNDIKISLNIPCDEALLYESTGLKENSVVKILSIGGGLDAWAELRKIYPDAYGGGCKDE